MHTHKKKPLRPLAFSLLMGVLAVQVAVVAFRDMSSAFPEYASIFLAQESIGLESSSADTSPPGPPPPPVQLSSSSDASSTSSSSAAVGRHRPRTWSSASMSESQSSDGEAEEEAESEAMVDLSSCGDGFLDPGEDCDLGELQNGTKTCSATCETYLCGDEIVSPQIGEQCEPPQKDVTYYDNDADEFYVVREFAMQTGGRRCTLPDESGFGGCRWKFFIAGMEIPSADTPSSPDAASEEAPETEAADSPAAPAPGLRIASCGDGVQDAGEECDQGEKNGDFLPDTCRTTCVLPRCGDGVRDVQRGESCDLGTENSNTTPNACRTDCRLPRCGDGVADGNEACDGGALCTLQCERREGAVQTPQIDDRVCGNGLLDDSEECDDGNVLDGDGCTRVCRREVSKCPNGIIDPGEECDDGNAFDGDQCSRFCNRELHRCGNGEMDPGEECDDAERNSDTMPDACRTNCMHARCGDRIVDTREQCDDGNLKNDDACGSACRMQNTERADHAAAPAKQLSLPILLFIVFTVMLAGVATGLRWLL